MSFILENIIRENIKNLSAYSSARDEYKGKEGIFLDANENSFGAPLQLMGQQSALNRYPDPLQSSIKEKLSAIKRIPVQNIFLGNGSDEAIDILFRAFCIPGRDNIIVCPPTYGMYEVSANINDINVLKAPLLPETFQLNTDAIIECINADTKLIFICCPNNPTGNGVAWKAIKMLLENFKGIMVVDEAYIDFANYGSLVPELLNYPNLVILQTLSKAWGLAGLRVGMAFASEDITTLFNKIKPPYNINSVSQELVLKALDNIEEINVRIRSIIEERIDLSAAISCLPFVKKVYPSDANFILVKMKEASEVYNFLCSKKIVVRNRSNVMLCENCLRITVGTKEQNQELINTLNQYTV
jgi:histidinol-phosphate aminotransferase